MQIKVICFACIHEVMFGTHKKAESPFPISISYSKQRRSSTLDRRLPHPPPALINSHSPINTHSSKTSQPHLPQGKLVGPNDDVVHGVAKAEGRGGVFHDRESSHLIPSDGHTRRLRGGASGAAPHSSQFGGRTPDSSSCSYCCMVRFLGLRSKDDRTAQKFQLSIRYL